jgi:outer membrane protein TolC
LIRFEVEQTFDRCVFLAEQSAASVGLQREREARAERVNRLSESGVRSEVEAAMAQADLARAKGQREAHFATLVTCRYQLGVLMGRAEGSQMPNPKQDPPSGATLSVPDVAGIMDIARGKRPDRKALVLQKKALKERLRQVHSMHLPELRAAASGGVAFQRDANDDLVDSGQYYAVGLAIEIPLFEGFRVQHLADVVAARLRAQDARIRGLDLRIRGEVLSARAQVMAGLSRVELAKQAVPAAQQALELARQEYDAGLVDALHLSTAETMVWQARVEDAEANAALNMALSAFQHAQGGP